MNSSSPKPLRIGWCDHKAALFAVTHWHYSKCMPSGRLTLFGVWEYGKFVGCVMFGRGAIHNIGKPFGVTQSEACELVRVAMRPHATPVSKIIAVCLRMLRKRNPNMRVVVSFADTGEGHHGGIYQAGGWAYVGSINRTNLLIHGKRMHPRSVVAAYGTMALPWLQKNVDANARTVGGEAKHKYVMALDKEMQKAILAMARPYPKRATSIVADAPGHQPGEGGSQPTVALQSKEPA